jgi:tetratricopeptide (TPR) repeat protein
MTGRQDLFDESMRLGHTAAWELDWERAVGYYRKALAEFPDEATALTSLGLALYETDQFKEALAVYHRACKAAPDDPIAVEKCAEIFTRLGQIKEAVQQHEAAADLYLRRKDAEKAVENWHSISRLSPDNVTAHSRLAVTYERLGRKREAVIEYLSIAAIFQRVEKADRAIEAVQRALAILPGEPEATRALRLLQEDKLIPTPVQPRSATSPLRMDRVKEYMRAETPEVEEQAQEEFDDPEVAAQRQSLTMLASLLFDEPRDDSDEDDASLGMSAITRGKLAKDRGGVGRPSMYRYLGQAIDLQTRGNHKQAIKEFERAIDSGLDHPAVHYNLGLLLKEVEDFDEARKHLMSALGHPELDLGANLALGRLLRLQGDLREAARHLMQALRVADNLSIDGSQTSQLNELYDTILASQEDGKDEELAAIVESTLNFLSGPEWLSRLREARQVLEIQESGGSLVPIADMLAIGGTQHVLQSLGRIDELAKSGHYSAAMEEAMLALSQAPSYLALHQRMAEILLLNGREEQAIEKLRMIAETQQIRGEIRQATESYSRILQHAPIDMKARNRMIDLLAQQGREDEALDQYLELAELLRQMAQIDQARKALADALHLAQQATVDRKRSIEILHQMGDIDLSRLDWRRALRVYEQIRTLDPSDEKSRMNVIDLDLRLGLEEPAAKELDSYLEFLVEKHRGSEALELLEEMAREHPGKQTLHARLAEAYRAAGRVADAIAQYDALGELQLDSGNVPGAIRTISTIIELNPPGVDGYQELLRNLEAGQ